MSKQFDAIFLDRDGTISHDPYGYINSLSDYHFFDYAFEALEIFSKHTDKFIIVTNQSGLARGKIDVDQLSEIHNYILNQFYKNNLNLIGIYFCPDHPDNPSINRKPGSGMFDSAARDHNINLNKSIMIGDAVSDIQAGLNLDMDTMLVLTGKGQNSKDNLNGLAPKHIVENIMAGAELMEKL